jgi:hypothetical protein
MNCPKIDFRAESELFAWYVGSVFFCDRLCKFGFPQCFFVVFWSALVVGGLGVLIFMIRRKIRRKIRAKT